ncbi:hypothetical protein [Enterococcus larvae]|uniref:hypothetical protein n=1 Tax=Enterococcus larvae TaxID=2794352 RepID=UPI003F34A94A
MNQLFDETYNDYRTIWYGYYEQFDQPDLIKEMLQIIENDKRMSEAQQAVSTSWVFYCKNLQGDALEEKVRGSIMVRLLDTHYSVHCNISDFEFVTQFDAIESWKKKLEAALNNK